MRWKKKERRYPKDGDERALHKFLFLPACINGECRWLEHAIILQRYYFTIDHNFWMDLDFINEEEAKHYKKNKYWKRE